MSRESMMSVTELKAQDRQAKKDDHIPMHLFHSEEALRQFSKARLTPLSES